ELLFRPMGLVNRTYLYETNRTGQQFDLFFLTSHITKRMTVLILGGMDDAHACHVLEHLRFGGTDAELFDSRWFPSALQIAYSPVPERGTLRLPTGRVLTFEEITSVYWRCYNSVHAPDLPDAEQTFIANNDARGLFESVLIRLGARWVNGWRAYQLHQTKPVQLSLV